MDNWTGGEEYDRWKTIDASFERRSQMPVRETIVVDAEGYALLVAAADRFVMKVETGRARSTETYHQLQDALHILEENNPAEKNAGG